MGSTASTTFQDYIEGKLLVAMTTSVTTGVTYKIKNINGVTPTHPTAAHRIKIVQRTGTGIKVEKIDVAAGTTQSGQTVTLGTLTRALPLNDGTDFTGSGTAQSFAAGADVFITWDAHDAAQTVKKDLASTITGALTISGDVVTSNSFKVPVYADSSARDAAITSPANGMLCYLTDEAVMYQYIGGAWSTFATGTTANGSATVAGKFEEATVAEQGTASATGGTGARLVPAVENLVKTGAGAGDENKIAVMNAAGALDPTLGGSGVVSPTAKSVLIGQGSSAFTGVAPGSAGNVLVSDGTDWTSGSTGSYQKKVVIMSKVIDAVSCAAYSTRLYGSGTVRIGTLKFDQTAAEEAFISFVVPDDFSSTFTVKFIWLADSTGGVTWGATGYALNDDDTIDAISYPAYTDVDDTVLAAGDVHISPAVTPTISGTPAAGDYLSLYLRRNPAASNDTMAADADLMGIIIEYTA